MELQPEPVRRFKTPRVKALVMPPSKSEVVVCLFSGDIQLYDRTTLKLTRSFHVSDVPVRSGVYVPVLDHLILGLDDGRLVVLEYGTLATVETLRAHDDFVRKIILDEINRRIVTVSDDNTTKLWSYSDGQIKPIRVYKESKHFVMDAAFCPANSSLFITVSLDKKVRLYSVDHPKCLETFRGHLNGVNCVVFINGTDLFATGSDDSTIIIWDYKRRARISTLAGHTNNITYLGCISNGIVSCSEDGTIRIWNNNFKTIVVRSFIGRVWCAMEIDEKLYVGTDEELAVFEQENKRFLMSYSHDKLFYTNDDLLRMMKTNEMGIFKELGKINKEYIGMESSPTGKYIGLNSNDSVEILSSLGLRKKMKVDGTKVKFIDDNKFCICNKNTVEMYKSMELSGRVELKDLFDLLYVDGDLLVIAMNGSTQIMNHDGNVLYKFDIEAKMATLISGRVVLFADQIYFYDSKFDKICEVKLQADSYCVDGDVLFVSTKRTTFYCICGENKVLYYSMKYLGYLLGAKAGKVFHLYIGSSGLAADEKTDTPLSYSFDEEFAQFQLAVLRGEKPDISESIKNKAVAFYEEIGMHNEALQLTSDDNQRFEILLRMDDFESALSLANSPAKFRRLGIAFLRAGKIEKSSECFKAAGDMNSLLLVDTFSGKKYLGEVGRLARYKGNHNLSFLAHFIAGDYQACLPLLENTPYAELFRRNYCN